MRFLSKRLVGVEAILEIYDCNISREIAYKPVEMNGGHRLLPSQGCGYTVASQQKVQGKSLAAGPIRVRLRAVCPLVVVGAGKPPKKWAKAKAATEYMSKAIDMWRGTKKYSQAQFGSIVY
ncbi:uncharacterized protein MELLADRAFT_107971 [Melampsora larici-populina 98AG31]|uniref:Uncharacterized protein n=1 Tax=Melampsora larici-populina (strain 98AG31 / pathotype 3-4-7) TaxID=747676 RepID=F4RRJ8_MELLP|nr:uncharacterized protein MELLADRAFT_107971 [Melampsora larici-populina 98AG31]EGG05014.1 hypothetical protein MELLADRAFT_107971 [Melampsora larici-populina 98AG31]